MNIVLMAGGGGSRLWPLSRKSTPKQFLDLGLPAGQAGSGKTLIEQAFERAQKLTDPSHIYVATSEHYRTHIEKLLPSIAQSHMFYEPEKRDTTAAFATIALRLEALGQAEEPTIFMWSDHIFTNEKEFLGDLKKIPQLISEHPEAVVIVGHVPVSAETGLGYVEAGEPLEGYQDVFRVKAFREKPDQKTAEHYVTAGNYFWNLGYFSARPSYILSELIEHNPELKPAIDAFRQSLAAPRSSSSEVGREAAYRQFPKVAIEYTFIEKTPHRLAITGDYGWSDIGNWATIKEVFGKVGDHLSAGHHVHVDSQNNYIYNATSRAVSLVGVKDTIVVVTDDAILVTNKDHSHKVKDVVSGLEAEGKEEYL